MDPELLVIPLLFVQIAVLVYIILRTGRLIRADARPMAAVFFLFGLISLLFSDLYWITYDFLRPGTRMPFAANELGENACFLLLGVSLNTVFRTGSARWEAGLTALFAGACTALWIAWTGEWADDILTGVCFGYLLCCTVRAIKLSGAFSRIHWLLLGAGAVILIAGQAATFFVPEPIRSAVDLGCYILMLLGIVFFFGLRAVCGRAGIRQAIGLTFGCYCWSLCMLYMSAGVYYVIAYASVTASLLLMLRAVPTEVTQA